MDPTKLTELVDKVLDRVRALEAEVARQRRQLDLLREDLNQSRRAAKRYYPKSQPFTTDVDGDPTF